MQMVQPTMAGAAPKNKSPFMSLLEGVSGVLTPFMPEAGIAHAGLHMLNGGGTTPFAQAIQSKTNQPSNTPMAPPPQMQMAPPPSDSAQGSGGGQSAPEPGKATPEQLAQIQQMHQQFPEEFGAILQNPQFLTGGQNFLSALQQYGSMLNQGNNQEGGMS